MTGYGSSQVKSRKLELEIHVKSVNGRFLELRFHLPKEYAPHENDLRKAFSQWKRGTVDVYIHRRPNVDARLQSVQLRSDHAKHWAKTLQNLARQLKISDNFTVRDILQMPFVLETQDKVALQPGELKMVEKQLAEAVRSCQKVRVAEGDGLKKELLALLKNLEACSVSMEKWREEASRAAEQRLKSRLSAINQEQIDPARLALEISLLLDKMDVHEEVVRLREHVKACRGLIEAGEAQGKKLDFYCQELLREVNTIGSKSQLASLTKVVVEAKSVIEKFREQVQNIE